jgi:tryptophanyl-tRNA synthetase
MKKRIFSGVQPSGVLHIGNYLGAIKQWVDLQNEENELIFCVVDLHAITVPQDPKELSEKIMEVAALYVACGIDPKKSKIFVQSDRPEHSELAWLLNCNSGMGELNRMTQFKDKSEKQSVVSVGLFDYPVLMAADILLYQATRVPVGEDQKQHVELTRDLAIRMNHKYGNLFTIPEASIKKESARIMGLDDPTKKMSKSADSIYNYIALTDDAETIRQKIKKAVTDSGSEIKSGADKPAINNLLNIFSGVTGKSVADIEKEYADKGYGDFKQDLAENLINFLEPIQTKYQALINNPDDLKEILRSGSRDIAPIASKTLNDVKRAIGLGIN